jgi:DNA-binding PadR family transcriptional regulator
MHKELHLLGLLLTGPKTGYQLHRIVVAHGELYTDLKKGNVYYLLERLAESGALQVTTETGAPGPRRERLVYTLTDQGRSRFYELLREVVRRYELAHTGVEVGMVFLPYLDPQEAMSLLEDRRRAVLAHRVLVERETQAVDHLHVNLAQDHLLSLIEAELAWTGRTLQRLREGQADATTLPATTTMRCPGAVNECPAEIQTDQARTGAQGADTAVGELGRDPFA